MSKYLLAYFGAALVFFTLDVVWLMYITKNFYKNELGHLLLDNPNMVAAGIFYIFYVLGIVLIAVLAGLRAESLWVAVGYGVLLGGLCYGTYEITNYATLNNWPIKVVMVDLIWGMFITGLSAAGGYILVKFVSN